MGLTIPGELADLLNEMGYIWPKTDETALFELGQAWLGFAGTVAQTQQDAVTAVSGVTERNQGSDVLAFLEKWNGEDSAVAALGSGVTGAQVLGGALFVCAGIVLALKINVIVQLTILAIEIFQAIATAPATFGGSLLEVPLFKKLANIAINLLINTALETVLG